MGWLSDEMLFYGGMALSACSVAAAVVFFFAAKLRKERLEALLDKEYGETRDKFAGRGEI